MKDIFGRPVVDNGQPYRGGMAFRCELDGSRFEVLADNFRNNYELAVDSFGGFWQSDNDDDGNRGVRINYLLEYGNYGYRDQMTGAGWQTPRTNLEATIPEQHWHQNDPGVVPNLLITGAGSPTGIVVYEGDAAADAVSSGQMIHCDAGPSVVRSYGIVPDGAGYRSTATVNLLSGARDHWFRPSDVCVAPDGSLIVADWYDPGVGGHRMGDIKRGRIFRLAPPKTPYRVPPHDFNSISGSDRSASAVRTWRRAIWPGRPCAQRGARGGGGACSSVREIRQSHAARAGLVAARRCSTTAAATTSRGPRRRRSATADDGPARGATNRATASTETIRKLAHDPSPASPPRVRDRAAERATSRTRATVGRAGPGRTTATIAGISKRSASGPTAIGTPASHAWLESARSRSRQTRKAGRDIIWRSRAIAKRRSCWKNSGRRQTTPARNCRGACGRSIFSRARRSSGSLSRLAFRRARSRIRRAAT